MPGGKPRFSLMHQSSNTDTEGNFDHLAQEEGSDEDSSLMSGHRRGDVDEVEGEDVDASSKRDGSQAISGSFSNEDGDDFVKPRSKKDYTKKKLQVQASSESQQSSKQASVILEVTETPTSSEIQLNPSQSSVAALPDSNTEKDRSDFEKERDSAAVWNRESD